MKTFEMNLEEEKNDNNIVFHDEVPNNFDMAHI